MEIFQLPTNSLTSKKTLMDHFVVEHSDYRSDTSEFKFFKKIGQEVAKHFYDTCVGRCSKTSHGIDCQYALPNQEIKPVVYGYQAADIDLAMKDENIMNEATNAFISTLIDRITHK